MQQWHQHLITILWQGRRVRVFAEERQRELRFGRLVIADAPVQYCAHRAYQFAVIGLHAGREGATSKNWRHQASMNARVA